MSKSNLVNFFGVSSQSASCNVKKILLRKLNCVAGTFRRQLFLGGSNLEAAAPFMSLTFRAALKLTLNVEFSALFRLRQTQTFQTTSPGSW